MRCPNCDSLVVFIDNTPECENCGAFATINKDSQNVIWMLNGRVIKADKDVAEAVKRMIDEWEEHIDPEILAELKKKFNT